MKKILSAVLALMMIIGCASFVSAKEPALEGANQVAFAIDDVEVTDATKAIEVPVNIAFAEDFDGIIGATLKFTFDTTKLTFDKKASSIEYPDSAMANVNINKSNVITLQYVAADTEVAVKEEGVFAILVFNAVEGAQGDAVIEFSTGVKVAQVGNDPATFNTTNGKAIFPAAEAEKFDVTFTTEQGTAPEAITGVEAGTEIDLPVLENTDDYTFRGWSDGETTYTGKFTVNATVTLTAVWDKIEKYTVTFETAHGTAPEAISIIDDDEDGKADEAFMFPGYDGKQDGHFTFTGWMDVLYVGAPEGTTIPKYNAGDILFLDGNKTFVATWEEDPKGTVTYRNESGEAPESYTEYVGTEIVIAECPAVEGFEFLGWISNGVTYQPGEKVTIEDEFGITFTAKWGVKVAVDANGAKGEVPVIGGAIGEEIDLPTDVNLTMVNHTFVGWATSEDGEVITGKYTVNPDDTLYAIWEETVANAAIIETKVTYYTGTGNYLVDIYFYGKDANTVAFGYAFGENLEFTDFTPAEGLSVVPADLERCEYGYYAYAVTNEIEGKIAAADKTEADAVHLGTITFTYTGAKEDYAEDDAADNVAITVPAEVIDNISSEEYFLYTPAVAGLDVEGKPVVFDEAIEVEIIDVEYPVKGSVKVVRDDENAALNFAKINVFTAQGSVVKAFTIEDAETKTVDGVFNYEIKLPEGEYIFVFEKTGYLDETVEVTVAAQEGAEDKAYEDLDVTAVGLVELVAGDVVAGYGVIDLLDFAGITSAFGRGDLEEYEVLALDINEDGAVTVDDLLYFKTNFGAVAE